MSPSVSRLPDDNDGVGDGASYMKKAYNSITPLKSKTTFPDLPAVSLFRVSHRIRNNSNMNAFPLFLVKHHKRNHFRSSNSLEFTKIIYDWHIYNDSVFDTLFY